MPHQNNQLSGINENIVKFDNSYSCLPEEFFQRINPVSVRAPKLIIFNNNLGKHLGFDINQTNDNYAQIFSGNIIPNGASPIALSYAGHQYGNFVNQLGDGRAVLLGEVTDLNEQRYDIQLKGSGQTQFSRRGDGRSPLGPVVREYILSEAMHSLNIPTTRSLAAVSSGEQVYRDTSLPGAILTRVAKSHIRIGTFEYFASLKQLKNLKTLSDYTIDRHYPEVKSSKNRYLSLLNAVSNKQAELIAHWMSIGFIHGVMNTDNTSITGETIDYGPCAFMDSYDPSTVFSSIDHHGRYSFGNQPHIIEWNLACFATCLIPLIDEDPSKANKQAGEIIKDVSVKINKAIMDKMRQKIGLSSEQKTTHQLLEKLLKIMLDNQSDYTLTFRYLCDVLGEKGDSKFKEQFTTQDEISKWLVEWQLCINNQGQSKEKIYQSMRLINPAFIPRNHLIERIIKAAVDHDDYSEMKALSSILSNPYKEQNVDFDYINPPEPSEKVYKTFCGT